MNTLKTMFQGALGAMSFGVYHQFTTNRLMELNNEKQDLFIMDKHQKEIDELKEQISKLNNKKGWYSIF